jgi:polysaccharide export outer membrane protein
MQMKLFQRTTVTPLALALAIGAVGSVMRTSFAQTLDGAAPGVASSSKARPELVEHYPRYVVQRGDVLAISFPLSPELDQTVTVQPDGYINLRNADGAHVQGLTVKQVVEALTKVYLPVLNNPIINVDLKDFQKPMFTVTGQVGKPGRYELRSNITVSEAIAVAGGLQSTAKSQVFLFHRVSSGWYKVEKINLDDLMHGKVEEDAEIKPDDMIIVPESAITKFKKYVPYSISGGTYVAP